MEKDFIRSNRLVRIDYYGITLRFDAIFVDQKASLWVVTKRTVSSRDDETWSFSERSSARSKFLELAEELNRTLFSNL